MQNNTEKTQKTYYLVKVTTKGITEGIKLFKTKNRIVKYINNHLESHYLEFTKKMMYSKGYFYEITRDKKEWLHHIKDTEIMIKEIKEETKYNK